MEDRGTAKTAIQAVEKRYTNGESAAETSKNQRSWTQQRMLNRLPEI